MQPNIYTHIYRGGYRGNIGQLEKDLIVKDIGQLIKRGDISLVVGEGKAGCLAWDLVSIGPSYKTHSARYKETLVGIAKQNLVVCMVLHPYITIGLLQAKIYSQSLLALRALPFSQALTPSALNRQAGLYPSQRNYYIA